MTYPFVQARHYSPGKMIEPRALIWHMAEGGGTVHYFQTTTRSVSAHFVVERSGRIVQMVKLADASWTQHIAFDPDDNDADDCGIYSEAVGRAVLGSGWADVNRFAIGIEVEGFRAEGPNAEQANAIAELHRHLRATLPTLRGNLGHRDVQDAKSCPGCKFPWSRIDGHGLFTEDIVGVKIRLAATAQTDPAKVIACFGTARIVGTGHDLIAVATGEPIAEDVPDGKALGIVQRGTAAEAFKAMFKAGEELVAYNVDGVLAVSPVRDIGSTFKPLSPPSTTDVVELERVVLELQRDVVDLARIVELLAQR